MAKQKPWVSGDGQSKRHVKLENRPEKLTPEMIYHKYDDLIHSIAKRWYRTLGQYDLTPEELAQRAYESLSSAAQRYDPKKSSPTTFIHYVLDYSMKELLRSYRAQKREAPGPILEIKQGIVEPMQMEEPSTKITQREQVKKIYRAIARLPPEKQELLIEIIRGKTYKEMAVKRGVSKQRIFARVREIRREMGQILNAQTSESEKISYQKFTKSSKPSSRKPPTKQGWQKPTSKSRPRRP